MSMTHALARLDPGTRRVAGRLVLAIGISAWLHAALLLGLPVDPVGGGSGDSVVISARLAPGSREEESPAAVSADSVALPADATPTTEREPPVEPVPPRADAAAAPPRAASPLPGLEVPLIRDPTYYPARLLDVYPSPLVEIRFAYPQTADADRVSGVVRLQLLIDEFGLVNELTVVEAAPPGYFEDAAREGLRQVRFTPGVREGRAVKSRVIIQVKFEYGTEGAVAR